MIPSRMQLVKELVFLQLWCRSQLWLRFSPWPGNFHMPQMWLGKKKKKKKEVTFLFHPCLQRPRQWTARTCTEGPCSVSPVHHPHSDLNLLHPPMTVHFSTHSGLTVSLGLHFHVKAAMHVKLTLKECVCFCLVICPLLQRPRLRTSRVKEKNFFLSYI